MTISVLELVRSLNLTPAALADFLKEQKKAPAASGQVGPKSDERKEESADDEN